MRPEGATHIGECRYYKREGNFWFVYEGGWFAISGEPACKQLRKLENDE